MFSERLVSQDEGQLAVGQGRQKTPTFLAGAREFRRSVTATKIAAGLAAAPVPGARVFALIAAIYAAASGVAAAREAALTIVKLIALSINNDEETSKFIDQLNALLTYQGGYEVTVEVTEQIFETLKNEGYFSESMDFSETDLGFSDPFVEQLEDLRFDMDSSGNRNPYSRQQSQQPARAPSSTKSRRSRSETDRFRGGDRPDRHGSHGDGSDRRGPEGRGYHRSPAEI